MPFPRSRIRVRWWIFICMFLFGTVAYMQRTSLAVATDQIKSELHVSQLQVFMLLWAFQIAYTALQMPGGAIGQRIGARAAFIVIGVVGFIATVAMPLAPVLLSGTALIGALVLAQAVLGAAQAPVFPVQAGVFEAWFPVSRWGLVNGIGTTGMDLGTAVTPPLIVALTASFGWQGALLSIAVPTAVLTALWAWYGRDTPREHPAVTAEELAELGEVASEKPAPVTLQRFLHLLANRNVALLAVSYLSMNYAFFLLTTAPFLYLVQERHLSQVNSGWLAVLPPIGAGAGAWLGGAFADRFTARFGPRWGYRLGPLVSLPLAGVLLLLAMHTDDAYLAVAVLTVAFAAVEFTEGSYWAATMQVARADTMAAGGVLNTGGNLGGVIYYPIAGYLSGHGAWNAAFATGTGFAIVAAVLWLLVKADQRFDPGALTPRRT